MTSPGDGYDVLSHHDGVIVTLINPVFHLNNLHRLLQAFWVQTKTSPSVPLVESGFISNRTTGLNHQTGLNLTWSLHSDFELSAAGSFSVNFKISHFFHPQTLRLETSARRPAGVRVTCCKDQSDNRRGPIRRWIRLGDDVKMMNQHKHSHKTHCCCSAS